MFTADELAHLNFDVIRTVGANLILDSDGQLSAPAPPSVDLSAYSTTTQVNTAISTSLNDYSTTTQMDSAIAASTPTYSPPSGGTVPNRFLANIANKGIGNILPNTTAASLDGKTFSEMLNLMIFPETYATVTQPSASISWGQNDFIVIGTSISTTISCSCSDGIIKNADNSTQNASATGDLTGATLSGFSGSQTLTVSGTQSISNFSISHTALSGSRSTVLTVSWADGPMPTSSINADQTSDQFLAGSKTATLSYTGVYPIFLGDSSGNVTTQHTLVSHDSTSIEVPQNYNEVADSVHHQIAIPNAMLGSRTLENGLDIQAPDLNGNMVTPTNTPWVASSITKNLNSTQSSVAYTLLVKSGTTGGGKTYNILLS